MFVDSSTPRPRLFDLLLTLLIGLCLAISAASLLFSWLERPAFIQMVLLGVLIPLLGGLYYWIWQTPFHKTQHWLVMGGCALSFILVYLFLPTFPIPYRTGSLEIIATGKKDALSEGKEIAIFKIQIDGQTIPLSQLNRQGGWLEEEQQLIHRKGGKATLSYPIPYRAKNIQITFASGPQAGRGMVKINDIENRFELYSENPGSNVQSYPAVMLPPLLLVLVSAIANLCSLLFLLPSVLLLSTVLRNHREIGNPNKNQSVISLMEANAHFSSQVDKIHPYNFLWRQFNAEKLALLRLAHAIISSLKTSMRMWGLVIISMIGIVILLWIPYGFDRGPTLDIWRVMTLGGNLFYQSTPPVTLQDLLTTRFIPMWQWYLGNVLTPDSFLGYNLLLAGTIAMLGVVFFGLLKTLLPGYQGLAFLAAVLAILNSTDDWYFTIENVHIQILILEFFLAVYLLLIFWRYPSRLLFLFIIAMQISIAGNYDSFYPLFLAVPLLLLWQDSKITRRWIITSSLWCLFPIIRFAGFVYATFIARTHYASSMVNDTIPLQVSLGSRFSDGLFYVYKMTLGFGYQEGVKQVVETLRGGVPPIHLLFSVVIALSSAVLYWFAFHKHIPQQPMPPKRWLIWLMGCFLFIFLGYLMYLPSPLGLINYRSLLLACPLAAILITGMVWITDRLLKTQNILFAAGMGILIGLSTLYSYDNIRNTFNWSVEQVNYVKLIAEQAPQVEDDTVFLISTNAATLSKNILQGFFPNTVDLIYDNPTLQAMWTDENGNTTFGKLQEMFGQNFKLDQCILLNYTQNKNVPHYGYVRSPNDPRAVHPLYINGKMELQNSVPSHLVPISIDTKQYIPRQRVLGKKLPQRLQSMFHYAQHGYQ